MAGLRMGDLSGKTALVTGGASGIGLATVEAFARRGARVALNHLPQDARGPKAIAALRAAGLDVIAAPGDVAKPGEAETMVREAIEKLGRLDYLANNAGTPATAEPIAPRDLDRLTEEFWAAILSTNLLGPFRCTHAAADALRAAQGAVCNTASVAGLNMPGSSMAYGASKAALISLTKNLARALAPQARVNAVAPGHVDTEWTRTWPAERKAAAIERTLLRRHCTAQDVASAIVFLCADNSMITAQTLVVDGGYSL
jgi:3-oxoacyl-[acyl-carrier protein] reductase